MYHPAGRRRKRKLYLFLFSFSVAGSERSWRMVAGSRGEQDEDAWCGGMPCWVRCFTCGVRARVWASVCTLVRQVRRRRRESCSPPVGALFFALCWHCVRPRRRRRRTGCWDASSYKKKITATWRPPQNPSLPARSLLGSCRPMPRIWKHVSHLHIVNVITQPCTTVPVCWQRKKYLKTFVFLVSSSYSDNH